MLEKFVIILAIIIIISVATATSTVGVDAYHPCPPPEALAPCSCESVGGDFTEFICEGTDEHPEIDLQDVFDRVTSALIDKNGTFWKIHIGRLSNRELPAHLTSLKFERIELIDNSIEFIHPDAFNSTMDTTTDMILMQNKLSNRNNSMDNFNFVNKFTKLESLTMVEDDILSIPSDPFVHKMPALKELKLGSCGLISVGSRMLANFPSLERATLEYCTMGLDGFAAESFHGVGPTVALYMEYLPIPYLPEQVFKPFLDFGRELTVGGRVCKKVGGLGCSNIRFDCSKSAWMCENVEVYKPRLYGVSCLEGDLYGMWDWCRDNNASH